jgi:hypothetical protein
LRCLSCRRQRAPAHVRLSTPHVRGDPWPVRTYAAVSSPCHLLSCKAAAIQPQHDRGFCEEVRKVCPRKKQRATLPCGCSINGTEPIPCRTALSRSAAATRARGHTRPTCQRPTAACRAAGKPRPNGTHGPRNFGNGTYSIRRTMIHQNVTKVRVCLLLFLYC